jgi:hypothetical protein
MNYELKITSAKIVIHNSEFIIPVFLAQTCLPTGSNEKQNSVKNFSFVRFQERPAEVP